MFQTRLFVGNLPNGVQENDLRSAFSSYGKVTNLDIKSKSAVENDPKTFAFVTLSAGNAEVENCIKFFGNNDFVGTRLYVTRARESFLERLQREREQATKKGAEKDDHKQLSRKHPVVKLGDKLNPKKRKNEINNKNAHLEKTITLKKIFEQCPDADIPSGDGIMKQSQNKLTLDKKKQESDKKRMESMQKKRQEFKNKQQIIKTGLIGVDKVPNKKLRFSDNENDESEKLMVPHSSNDRKQCIKNILFDGDDSDSEDEVNFEIKKQFEGKKGQKVLDLQSRYKSDKRFALDERFIDDAQTEDENEENKPEQDDTEQIDTTQDEKSKQMKILEDVLGVAITSHVNKPEKDKKAKPNLGMIRFDPMNPEHAKFVIPIEEVKQETKKSKKPKKEINELPQQVLEIPKVEVSKEQFYKSEITKEAFEQPAEGFSLRSLFSKNVEEPSKDHQEQDETHHTQLQPQKQQRVKNPLDPGEKNPFVYDSSESEGENEDEDVKMNGDVHSALPEVPEVKAVWKEKLFFSEDDSRLKDGLIYFNNVTTREGPKERRELKSVMMKRIHNSERKNQMFKKKIGGRKKSMKKSYNKRS